MAKNEAIILPVKCVETGKTFYARYDFAYDGVWVLTYGLKDVLTDLSSDRNNAGISKIDLSYSRIGPQYKCPHCGNLSFVRCGQCKNLTCYSGKGDFLCRHCGNTGVVSGTIDSLEGDKRRSQ